MEEKVEGYVEFRQEKVSESVSFRVSGYRMIKKC